MNREKHKARLTSLLEELTGRVERTHRHLHERDGRVSGNFPDQSQEMENQELVYNLDKEGREELKQIKDALARIADGSFGSCQECGKKIQDGRIEAVPYTSYCIQCAEAMES